MKRISKKRLLALLATVVALLGLSLAVTPSAQAGGTACDKSVSNTKAGGMTGDTTIASATITKNSDGSETATYPVKDTSYEFCAVDLDETATDSSGSTVHHVHYLNDHTPDTASYVSNGSNYTLDNLMVTFGKKSSTSPSPKPSVKPTVKPSAKPTVKPVAKPTTTKLPVSTGNGGGSGSRGLPVGAGTDLGRYSPASQNNTLALTLGGLGLLAIAGGITLLVKRSRA